MNFGNPGQFSHWDTRRQFVWNNMCEASRRPRRNRKKEPPSGCLSVILLIVFSGLLALRLFGH